jgi:hypothetical protein
MAPPEARLRRLRSSVNRMMASTRLSSVESSSVSTPARASDCRKSASRWAAMRKAFAEAGVVGVDQQLLAGFDVAYGDQAEVGQVQLQRVEQAHGDDFMAACQLAQRFLPAGFGDEVGHHKHGGAPAHQVGGGFEQLVQAGGAQRGFGPGLQGVQQMQHVVAAAARGDHGVHARSIEHGADAVAVAGQHARQHGDKFGRDIALALLAGAEVHGRAQVQQEPGAHLAVFGEDAHMGLLQPGGDVPVDVAHVVMVLVFAQVGQVHAGAAQQRAVVALQQAVEPAQHRPLEAAQQLLRAGLLRIWLWVQAARFSWLNKVVCASSFRSP